MHVVYPLFADTLTQRGEGVCRDGQSKSVFLVHKEQTFADTFSSGVALQTRGRRHDTGTGQESRNKSWNTVPQYRCICGII